MGIIITVERRRNAIKSSCLFNITRLVLLVVGNEDVYTQIYNKTASMHGIDDTPSLCVVSIATPRPWRRHLV